MNKKIKLLVILLITILTLFAGILVAKKIYAAGADYNFREVPSGLLIKSKATGLIGKVFNNGLELPKNPARKYLLCVEEYNRNLSNSNSRWKVARVMDFNMKDSKYTDPTYAIGYKTSSTKKSTKTNVNAKLAAYAYFQNTYGIDAYQTLSNGKQTYRVTLKNLVNELKKSGNDGILLGYGDSKSGYSGLIGLSQNVNSKFSTALNNYANFAKVYSDKKGELFDYKKSSSLKYQDNLLGPYDVNLAKNASLKSVTVPHTTSKMDTSNNNKTTTIKTGVEVTKVTVSLKNGRNIDFTKNSSNKLKRKNSKGAYENINFNAFDWNSNFYINIPNIKASEIKSIKLHYSYNLYYARYAIMGGNYANKKYSDQGYMGFEGKAKKFTGSLTLGVPSVTNNGIIKLTKADENNAGVKIAGAKFQILKANGSKYTVYKTITTNASGYAECSVPLGSIYYVKEIAGNTDYDYKTVKVASSNLADTKLVNLNKDKVVKITGFNKNATKDVTLQLVLTNRGKITEQHYAKIKKICSETGRGVPGVTFTIYGRKSHDNSTFTQGRYTTNNEGYIDLSFLPWTYTYYVQEERTRQVPRQVPHEVLVDEDGDGKEEVKIEYLTVYDTEYYLETVPYTGYYAYTAQETATNERYIINTDSQTIIQGSDLTVRNNPKSLTIRGYVFNDVPSGKESEFDGLYTNGTDRMLSGIKVELYNADTNSKVRETTTQSNGSYEFSGLSQFADYYVNFKYDGQEYMATYYNVGESSNYGRNSLATESQEMRMAFNEKFETISAATDPNMDRMMEACTGANGKDELYCFNVDNKDELGRLISFDGSTIVIDNVNLGLAQREKSDVALEKDVYSATVKIKDYETTYNYNTRRLDTDFSTWDIKDRLSIEGYYSKVYNRSIYASDYDYKCNLYNNMGLNISTDTELKIYITYILKVKNCSQSIQASINEIVDYYDKDYTYVPEMSYIKVNNNQEDLQVSGQTKYGTNKSLNGFNNLYITGLDEYQLITGDYMNIYVTFEVNKDQNKNILIDQDLQTMKITTGKENLAEINAYSTYYGDNTYIPNMEEDQSGMVAGIIDVDSTPGNLNDSNKYDTSKYEDDTGKAPNITVTLDTKVREINGYAWEDNRTQFNNNNQANIGNGTRDSKENLINGVTVQLIEKIEDKEILWKTFKTGSTEDLKAIFGLNINGRDYITVDKNDISKGKYVFKSFLPGNYYIKFTYGDSVQTALSSKADWFGEGIKGLNDKSYNGSEYKSTIYQVGNENTNSDAKDIWARRQEVNAYAQTLKNNNSETLAIFNQRIFDENNKNLELLNEAMAKTSMTAVTNDINLDIEYQDVYKINNIDLGLTERPKPQLVLNKTVENVKLVLADGTILYDASQKMSHVLWNTAAEGHTVSKDKGIINQMSIRNKKGLVQLTVDEEYMTGATVLITYKLTVTNVGETDYNEESFYYTGNVANANSMVKTSAKKVIDYVENNLGFDASLNSGWQVVEKDKLDDGTDNSKLLSQGYVSNRLKDQVNSYNTILVTEDLSKELAPGESITKQLVLSKTLSSNDEETSFTNNAEIVEIGNPSGVNPKGSIPGNQDPTVAPTELDSEDADTVTLLTPFGAAKNVLIKTGIVVAALVIIATGIVLIRKKILGVKKK
ncbi:MAG: SpaA isopeptide-forming pilin-related protein [Clostridia bacterium]|nr:SpaA isopeptide-forming pilin-related protein [Clostridia bacterium]